MALVDNHQSVPATQLRKVLTAGQGLSGGYVDQSLRLAAATANLSDLLGIEFQMLGQAISPLLDEGLAVHYDECGDPGGGR